MSKDEIIPLSDGTKVCISRDTHGNIVKKYIPPYTEKVSKKGKTKIVSRYRQDGTLWLVREYDINGGCIGTEYDKTGKKPVCTVFERSPFKDDPDFKLISKKTKKRQLSFQKQKGE